MEGELIKRLQYKIAELEAENKDLSKQYMNAVSENAELRERIFDLEDNS